MRAGVCEEDEGHCLLGVFFGAAAREMESWDRGVGMDWWRMGWGSPTTDMYEVRES